MPLAQWLPPSPPRPVKPLLPSRRRRRYHLWALTVIALLLSSVSAQALLTVLIGVAIASPWENDGGCWRGPVPQDIGVWRQILPIGMPVLLVFDLAAIGTGLVAKYKDAEPRPVAIAALAIAIAVGAIVALFTIGAALVEAPKEQFEVAL